MPASSQPVSSPSNRRYLATVPPAEILPIIDSHYESSVDGIYVVGDAAGIPLVKIAANQGRDFIQQLSKRWQPADGSRPAAGKAQQAERTNLDLVIVGGGPAGISAAIEAAKLGWRYVILERSKIANTVRSFPAGKKVYAEPRSMPNRSELDCDDDLDRDEFLRMVEEKVAANQLHIKEHTEVKQIRKRGEDDFEIETGSGHVFRCHKVLVAIGRQGSPRLLDVPGADNHHKVTYRFHSPDDYLGQKVLVVGGGNSAIETALMLAETCEVTLAYRGEEFFRAKPENRKRIEQAIKNGQLQVLFRAQVKEIRDNDVDLVVDDQNVSIPNDSVIIQIGTLPPIDFLLESGLELDGIWTPRRFFYAGIGLLVGLFIYFAAGFFVLVPEKAGPGRWYLPLPETFSASIELIQNLIRYGLPIPWLILLGVTLLRRIPAWKKRAKFLPAVPGSGLILAAGAILFYLAETGSTLFTFDEAAAGPGPYHLPGFEWLFFVIPRYFANLSGFYYFLYFTAILVFGLYWAFKINHPILWRRNLTIIAIQWTVWWGIPTFLVVFLGTNPWTPFLSRLLNAWPLKMDAFDVDAGIVGLGDPQWWYLVAVVAVVWGVFLTFVLLPLFTIRYGKIYCSYICSCGALAETVGNSFRHRGPKGDAPRKLERFGFVILAVAALVTIASLLGWEWPRQQYNVWVGTLLAGAIAVGLYPFLGQRLWCRLWCPLAFWMNFWGRWSRFKISAEKGKCIDCNMCNQYCQMGIDIKSRALQGKPVTLVDTPCVGCAECVMRCPMEILHIGDLPAEKLTAHTIGDKT